MSDKSNNVFGIKHDHGQSFVEVCLGLTFFIYNITYWYATVNTDLHVHVLTHTHKMNAYIYTYIYCINI